MSGENPGDETLYEEEINKDEPEAEVISISEEDLDHGDEMIASALAAFERPEFKLDALDEKSGSPELENATTTEVERKEQIDESASDNVTFIREKIEADLEERYKTRLSKAGKKIKALQNKIETLEKKLEEASAVAEDFKGKWIRVSADYQNYQKRSRNKMNEFIELERMNLIRDFLPVVENLKRALEHMESDNDVRKGLEMIDKQVEEMLVRWNVREIPAKGESFDPYCHDAIDRIEDLEHPPNTILEVVSPGYFIGDKVLRPSKVIVSCRPRETQKEHQKQEETHSDVNLEKTDMPSQEKRDELPVEQDMSVERFSLPGMINQQEDHENMKADIEKDKSDDI